MQMSIQYICYYWNLTRLCQWFLRHYFKVSFYIITTIFFSSKWQEYAKTTFSKTKEFSISIQHCLTEVNIRSNNFCPNEVSNWELEEHWRSKTFAACLILALLSRLDFLFCMASNSKLSLKVIQVAHSLPKGVQLRELNLILLLPAKLWTLEAELT